MKKNVSRIGALALAAAMAIPTAVPVSYTHLGVYKRQVLKFFRVAEFSTRQAL